MRLVIDARMYYASGIGTYLRNLIPVVVKKQPDFQFIIIGDKTKLAETDWAGSKNVELIDCTIPIYSIKEQLKLPGLIPPNGLFFSPHYNIPVFYSGPKITTIHDIFHLSNENKQRTFSQYFYARAMLRLAMKKSKIVMTDSEFTLSEMKKYGLPCLEKVRVVYLGFGGQLDSYEPGNSKKGDYLLYVGNVKPHKNLRRLIDAYKSLINANKINLPLRIVGEAEKFITGMPELKQEISKSSWSEKITFTGWIDDNELKAQYDNAAALILPSLYEGFGLPPLEAMASGCPSVVSTTGSLPEICGDASLYCDPYDVNDIAAKIVEVLENELLRRELIVKGYERLKLFNWNNTAEKFVSIVHEAVAGQ